ncbi:MAG TPA: enoyl-CoA hydratase-related protein, partial [Caldimonas sp.]
MTSFLRYEQSGPVVTLTMDAPESRNALTGGSATQEFVDACARIADDTSVRVVVLTGAGTVFSSGGNLKHMQSLFDQPPSALRQWYRQGIQRLATSLYNLEVPTIATVNGPAIGAGCDLTCMCDIRIASENASF